ncbi:MAG: nucleoside-diphosphate kinase [Verrucomicrobia bacterium]|nr:nucleoside-diphosphate kinase [Verrucomicrobiota bacterium]MDA1065500.1 nucleoside-diphosphate kinase [Verrucomicrobiota bacterium]
MEKTLIIFKPDCMKKNLMGSVLSRFQSAGFSVAGCKMMQLETPVLREHYAHIADRPFFPEIEAFMASEPVVAMILQGEGVIEKVRELLGPTDSTQAPAGTIRGDFGETVMINVVHASDSPEAAEAEIKRFFSDSDLIK